TSGQLRELLDTALSWEFEIFRLEDLTRGRPLAHLGLALMGGRFDVCAALECDERTLLHWLTVNLDRDSYKTVRHNVIDMILATEMTKHFEHLAKFVNVFYAKSSVGSKEDGMHAELVTITTLFKEKDLPVVMPMFDRATCSIPRSQIGFIDYIIIDMMEAWAELVNHARNNHTRWDELDKAGVTTIADVKRAQRQSIIQPPPTTTSEPTAEE
ncbi:High affinity cAMP-specific and IBMX-insensitive 3',5'-cyclic phosphodiesterase, partial [Operophtera brumata]